MPFIHSTGADAANNHVRGLTSHVCHLKSASARPRPKSKSAQQNRVVHHLNLRCFGEIWLFLEVASYSERAFLDGHADQVMIGLIGLIG